MKADHSDQISIEHLLDGVDDETRLPYGVSRYYASLSENPDPYSDPIAAQYMPRIEEQTRLPYETPDPLNDQQYSVSTRVVHHYKDRILILVNDRCATYCRHCFRRHFTGSSTGRISPAELDSAARYISSHSEIHEVLLSGGDPLMLPDGELFSIIDQLKRAALPRRLIIRLASRMPVVLPKRITSDLADGLREAGQGSLWFVTHANHHRELTPDFELAVSRLVDRGIPVLNQAVLLKGVNDSVDELEQLFRTLYRMRVKPYYLFQGDLAAGTAHFRTSIDQGLDIMDALRLRLTGAAMPTYAVDLPNGAGKIALDRSKILSKDDDWYYVLGNDGKTYRYPRE